MRYLIVTYVKKPDGQVDESVEIDTKYRPRHKTMANVVLDFAAKKVLKCRMEGNIGSQDWETVRDYYHKHYDSVVEEIEEFNIAKS